MTTSSAPVDGAADALQVLRNRTFDEIAIGDSASLLVWLEGAGQWRSQALST